MEPRRLVGSWLAATLSPVTVSDRIGERDAGAGAEAGGVEGLGGLEAGELAAVEGRHLAAGHPRSWWSPRCRVR